MLHFILVTSFQYNELHKLLEREYEKCSYFCLIYLTYLHNDMPYFIEYFLFEDAQFFRGITGLRGI